ncbi:hypothetical protein Taro_016764, partial [Colocasia esculenta]|nr:hypothetical protein [Colocasia esculenta]
RGGVKEESSLYLSATSLSVPYPCSWRLRFGCNAELGALFPPAVVARSLPTHSPAVAAGSRTARVRAFTVADPERYSFVPRLFLVCSALQCSALLELSFKKRRRFFSLSILILLGDREAGFGGGSMDQFVSCPGTHGQRTCHCLSFFFMITTVEGQATAFQICNLARSRENLGLCPFPRNKKAEMSSQGKAPLVIARGGLSGLLPDSSASAYALAQDVSLPSVLLWCDVQLTKDGMGICLPDVNMDGYTNIADIDPNAKEYVLNGAPVSGHFSLDYNYDDLSQVFVKQNITSRTDKFDDSDPIVSVNEMETQLKDPHLWLNIQHDMFYSQHNLSMRSYLLSVTRHILIDYVSSPEVSFLRSVAMRFKKSNTKLIFRFLGADIADASTNQTYGSLLKNLTFIKTFASGILVPKSYIWPVNEDNYLQPYTSVVLDAHRAGLEVFAAGFVNDDAIPYNYSYDPIAEYLSFVDNGAFSVDGVLSDFSVTASAAIGIYHMIPSRHGSGPQPILLPSPGPFPFSFSFLPCTSEDDRMCMRKKQTWAAVPTGCGLGQSRPATTTDYRLDCRDDCGRPSIVDQGCAPTGCLPGWVPGGPPAACSASSNCGCHCFASHRAVITVIAATASDPAQASTITHINARSSTTGLPVVIGDMGSASTLAAIGRGHGRGHGRQPCTHCGRSNHQSDFLWKGGGGSKSSPVANLRVVSDPPSVVTTVLQ